MAKTSWLAKGSSGVGRLSACAPSRTVAAVCPGQPVETDDAVSTNFNRAAAGASRAAVAAIAASVCTISAAATRPARATKAGKTAIAPDNKSVLPDIVGAPHATCSRLTWTAKAPKTSGPTGATSAATLTAVASVACGQRQESSVIRRPSQSTDAARNAISSHRTRRAVVANTAGNTTVAWLKGSRVLSWRNNPTVGAKRASIAACAAVGQRRNGGQWPLVDTCSSLTTRKAIHA